MEEMDADPSLPASAIATSPVHLAAPPPLSASRSYHQEPPGLCHSSSRTFAPRSCLFPPDPGTPCSLSLTPAFPRASDMCTGKCARCLGLSLIPLSLICIVANALLLVPDGKTTWTGSNLSLQVWLMGGFIGGGLMVRMGERWPGPGGFGQQEREEKGRTSLLWRAWQGRCGVCPTH